MLPDGSGIRVRDGFEYNERYAVTTSPAGRQAYMIETSPPGVGLGYRHMILNTSNKLPYIVEGEYIRDRTQAFGANGLAEISFTATEMAASISPLTTLVQISRSGRMSGTVTFRFRTIDGTALAASGHYNAVNTLGDSTEGGIKFLGITVFGSGTGKYFYAMLSEVSSGAILEEPIIIKINIP